MKRHGGNVKANRLEQEIKLFFSMKICLQWPSINLAAPPARGGREAKCFISACISFGSFL